MVPCGGLSRLRATLRSGHVAGDAPPPRARPRRWRCGQGLAEEPEEVGVRPKRSGCGREARPTLSAPLAADRAAFGLGVGHVRVRVRAG